MSQNKKAGSCIGTRKSFSKEISQTISQVARAMDRYSASAEDLDTVCCFFDFQETKEVLISTQKPDIDLRVSGHAAQSESENILNLRSDEEL